MSTSIAIIVCYYIDSGNNIIIPQYMYTRI